MPQVSKYPISRDVYERIFDIFLNTLARLKTRKKVAAFLKEFLTPTEQVMLAKRLAIAFLLRKDYRYREISEILKVSLSTVGFIAMDLKDGENYKRVIDRVLKDEEVEKFIEEVGEKVAALFAVGGTKSGTWRYLRDEIRSKKGKPF